MSCCRRDSQVGSRSEQTDSLIRPQGSHGIDARRPVRRNPGGRERSAGKCDGGSLERQHRYAQTAGRSEET
jgi:hypothetical protein